jgi:hypothetical protein
MDLPDERTSRIASALNSGGYCGADPGTWTPFRGTIVLNVRVSVRGVNPIAIIA